MSATEWSIKHLGELMSLEYGSGLPAGARSGEGFPVYGSRGEVGRHEHPLVSGPGIVVGRKGTVGAVAWSAESFWPIDTTYYVVPRQRINLRWCYWLMSHLPLERLDSSTGVPGLNRNDVYSISVNVPPIGEQHRIAEILDSADAAIQKSEALISKLKQTKTGLMHDLLTRGIDEHGQLRDPNAHPEQFKDSPLGRIPREWKVAPLGSIAEMVTSGSRGWARYYSDEGPMFLRIGNLTREHINLRLNDLMHVRPPANGEGSRTQVREGDLLISITADLGIIGVIPEHFGEAYVNQHIALVRLKYGAANPRWVGIYLAGDKAQKLFYRLNDSGAKAGLNLPTISALPIPLPMSREQHRITEIHDAHDARIRTEEAYRDKLKLQKKGLMEDLLTGRVRVRAGGNGRPETRA